MPIVSWANPEAEYWQALTKTLRMLIAAGATTQEITDSLNAEGLRSVRGRKFSKANVAWILRRLGLSTATYTRHLPSRKRRPKREG